jgi:hypothetical protein
MAGSHIPKVRLDHICLITIRGEKTADPGQARNRYNPEGIHAHSTPLHQAVLAGHEAVVRLLVERGARLDIRDTVWRGTPLGWARYGGGKAQAQMAECLRSLGAAK